MDNTVRRRLIWCGAVFLLALATRLTYFVFTEPKQTPDSLEYVILARNIRAHGIFTLSPAPSLIPSIRRAPAYPAFLVLVGGGGGEISPYRVRLWQGVLDALIAALICFLAWAGVKRHWAIFAGVLYALHPGALVYSGAILSEGLFTSLFTGAAAVLIVAVRADRIWAIAAAGILSGLSALCRPIAAPFFLVVVAVIYYCSAQIKCPTRAAVAFSVAAALTMAPWIIRSSLLAGHFVLVTATSTLNLSLATTNGPWDINDQASIFGAAYYRTVDPCGRAYVSAVTARESVRADRVCLKEALENLRTEPGYYLRTRVRQLVHFPLTSFDFFTGNTTSVGTALKQWNYWALAIKLAFYCPFALLPLLAGLAGLFCKPRSLEMSVCGGAWLFIIVAYAPGFVEYRYFFPAVPLLLVTAAFGCEAAEQTVGRILQRATRARVCIQ